MKKGLFLALLLSFYLVGNAGIAIAAGKGYYENNKIPDKIHVLKIDNSGSTGNFVVLESNGKFAIIDAGCGKTRRKRRGNLSIFG